MAIIEGEPCFQNLSAIQTLAFLLVYYFKAGEEVFLMSISKVLAL